MTCYNPIIMKEPSKVALFGTTPVPCGKCLGCLQKKRADWTFRLLQEANNSIYSTFLTLTYNDARVPLKTTEDGIINLTLKKEDVQKFIKRLRHKAKELKYYIIGEYGEENGRPHYHGIIFNAYNDDIANAWTEDGEEIGNIECDEVNQATIHYVTKYMINQDGEDSIERLRPFSLMSKGLGKIYLKKAEKFHKRNMSTKTILNGQQTTIPRYYKDKIFTEQEKQRIKYKMQKEMDKKPIEDWNEKVNKRENAKRLTKHSKSKKL